MPSLIRDKSGIFYVVTYLNGKRVWRSLHTRDRKEANRIYRGEPTPSAQSVFTSLKDAIRRYQDYVQANLSPKTHEIYLNVFKHFQSFVGNKRIENISTFDIDLYKSDRAKRVSPHSVNQDLRCLRAFFNRLVVWNVIKTNPCRGVKDIRIVETIRPFLSIADLRRVLECTNGSKFHDIILFAAMTGLRRGEILNLKWENVDLQRGAIVVKSDFGFHTKGGRIRLLPINSTLRNLLESMPSNGEYVFCDLEGSRFSEDYVSKSFKKAIRECGLHPKLHFHSLRHTFASLLVQSGVSLYQVQKLLGHSSPRVTEIYAHLGGIELLGSVEILSHNFNEGLASIGTDPQGLLGTHG